MERRSFTSKKYFASLLEELEEVPESVIDLLRLSRGALEMFRDHAEAIGRELYRRPRAGATRRAADGYAVNACGLRSGRTTQLGRFAHETTKGKQMK